MFKLYNIFNLTINHTELNELSPGVKPVRTVSCPRSTCLLSYHPTTSQVVCIFCQTVYYITTAQKCETVQRACLLMLDQV